MDTRKGKSKRAQSSSDPKKIILRPRRVDYPRKDREHSEEYAAEVSPLPMHVRSPAASEATEGNERKEVGTTSRMTGYVGLAFGIASLFIWSIVMGPIAAVVGYYAYAKGQKTAGAWAMGLGIVATLSYFVMIPFAR